MKTYEKYKPSGIEWIGDIPEHWEIKKLKYLAKILNGQDHKNVWDENGIYPIIGTGGEFGKANQYLHSGMSVILGRKGTIDKPQFIETAFWSVDTAYYTDIFAFTDPKFFFYCCKTINFDLYKYGSAVPSMSQEVLKHIFFATPTLPEQTTIADYLDEQTEEIDKLIANKERLIELLKEERAAIINTAVTRGGINAGAKLKPSGIDWLGDISEHWEVKRLKYVSKVQSSNVDKKSFDDETSIFLCNYVDVYKNEFINENIAFMEATASRAEIKKFILNLGDVLITKDSETPDDIANPALVLRDFDNVLCGYHLAQIKPDKRELIGEYLFRLFQSEQFNTHFEIAANGVTRYGLPLDSIKGVFVTLPPIQEQKEIVEFIESKANEIDSTISKIEKEIELIKEYRTALISEVVTGKIKVVK